MNKELTDAERAQGFIRPLRHTVIHNTEGCGRASAMSPQQAEDMALDPKSPEWSSCWCCVCGRRLPVDQFIWQADRSPVGS